MIDSSDGDTFWIISLVTNGPIAIAAIILAIVLWCIAAGNEANCKQLPCPVGMSAKLLDHECVCVGKPLLPPSTFHLAVPPTLPQTQTQTEVGIDGPDHSPYVTPGFWLDSRWNPNPFQH